MLKYKMINNREQQFSKSWCIFEAGLQLLGWRFAFPKLFATTQCLWEVRHEHKALSQIGITPLAYYSRSLPNCIVGQHLDLKPKNTTSSSVSQWAEPAHSDPGREVEFVWAVPLSSYTHTPPPSGLLKHTKGNCWIFQDYANLLHYKEF